MFAFLQRLGVPKIKVPPEHFGKVQYPFTPDLPELQEKDYWWVFVTGEDMPGHHHDWLMDPATPAYEGFTAKPDYILWRKYLRLKTVAVPMQADAIPYVSRMRINGEAMYPAARLKGCLFKIRPKHFLELDEYRTNGVAFARRRVNVLIPYSTLTDVTEQAKIYDYKKDDDGRLVKTFKELAEMPGIKLEKCIHHLQAWMYEGLPDYWRTLGDSPQFIPSNPIRSERLGKMAMPNYYHFSGKDYLIDKAKAPSIINGYVEQDNQTQARAVS